MKKRDYVVIDFKNGQYEAYFEVSEVAKRLNLDPRTVRKYIKEDFYQGEKFNLAYLSAIQVKSRRGNPNF
jgi:hypothetical protein